MNGEATEDMHRERQGLKGRDQCCVCREERFL